MDSEENISINTSQEQSEEIDTSGNVFTTSEGSGSAGRNDTVRKSNETCGTSVNYCVESENSETQQRKNENSADVENSEDEVVTNITSDDQSDTTDKSLITDDERDSMEAPWCGTSLVMLHRAPVNCGLGCSDLQPTQHHTIFFHVGISPNQTPVPYPKEIQDKWDFFHVKMPCSPRNLYTIDKGNGKKILHSRWDLIQMALCKEFRSVRDLEFCISSYVRIGRDGKLTGFRQLCSDFMEEESDFVFSSLIPSIANLALNLPQLVTQPIPLLRRQECHSISISQLQVASLLANAFFCTFPSRSRGAYRNNDYSNFPDVNFINLLQGIGSAALVRQNNEKMRAFLNYFRRVVRHEPKGIITYSRQQIPIANLPKWGQSKVRLPLFHISSQGVIEVDGHGMLQVDFANRFLGGGVLGHGCVQEEIRFAICPELVAGLIWFEALDDNEAIVITGCEQYSKYSGYGNTFKWDGNFRDSTPFDENQRRQVQIVAIDAYQFNRPAEQYQPKFLRRELNKAYAGFYQPQSKSSPMVAVASGNWGCGVFNGNPHLKCLLQLMAAGESGRELVYFTFGNTKLQNELFDMYTMLVNYEITIGMLWSLLCKYYEQNKHKNIDLYEFLYHEVLVVNGVLDLEAPNEAENGSSLKQQESSANASCSATLGDVLDEMEITELKDVESTDKEDSLFDCLDTI